MAEWTEQHARTEIPGWVIEGEPGVVTLEDETVPVGRSMDLEHVIELRDTLTEAIERAGGVITQVTPDKPVESEPRVWPRRNEASAPEGVTKVRDRDGDLWIREGSVWQYANPIQDDYMERSWGVLLATYGPLTEVKS